MNIKNAILFLVAVIFAFYMFFLGGMDTTEKAIESAEEGIEATVEKAEARLIQDVEQLKGLKKL